MNKRISLSAVGLLSLFAVASHHCAIAGATDTEQGDTPAPGKKRILPPAPTECPRSIMAAPRRDQAGDMLRQTSRVRQLRVVVVQHAEDYRLVQRQTCNATPSALREPKRNQPAIRVADDVDVGVRRNETVDMRCDQPDLFVLIGVAQPNNVVGSGSGAATGAPGPWSALDGQVTVDPDKGKIDFAVHGLVLAAGNAIGTPGTTARVKGTLVCDTDGSASGGNSVVVDTPRNTGAIQAAIIPSRIDVREVVNRGRSIRPGRVTVAVHDSATKHEIGILLLRKEAP